MPRRREIPTRDWVIDSHVPPRIDPSPLNDLVRDCIEEMSEEDQSVLFAFFYERLTLAEIADGLGLAGRPSGHYRVKSALERLRTLLEEKGITDDLWD